MIVDALVVGQIVSELQAILVNGRIQQVVQPTPESLGLEVYAGGRRYNLLLSASATHARLHLVPNRLTRGPGADSPLLLLLRKYVRSGRITAIDCPPLERFVTLSITRFPQPRNPDDEDEPLDEPFHSKLVLEVLGRSSNLILLNDSGLILESVRKFDPQRSERPIMPRTLYSYPPQQAKRDPHNATADGIRSLEGPNLARAIVAAYRGISPQTGREVAMRSVGDPQAPLEGIIDPERVATALRELVAGADQRPCIARDASGMPMAVAPHWLEQYPHVSAQPSMSEAVASAFAELDRQTGHSQLRDTLVQRLADWTQRAQTRADQLRLQLERAEALDQLRWEGEMIYAYLHTISPRQTELLLDTSVIVLDPKLSGVENAQRRFREYDKAKSAVAGVPQLVDEAERLVEYGNEMIALLRLADSHEEIMAFERELSEQGVFKAAVGKKTPARRSGPTRIISPDGWIIYAGRSAAQNEQVTFELGRPDDIWLHVRGRPGGHVIIRMQGTTAPPATLERAAQLAAFYSSGRNDGAVEVDLAHRKHVRKIRGGPPGLVRVTAEQSLRVAPLGPQPAEQH